MENVSFYTVLDTCPVWCRKICLVVNDVCGSFTGSGAKPVKNKLRASPRKQTSISDWKPCSHRGVMVTVNRSSERVRQPGWLFCQWLIHSAFQLCCEGVMQMPLCCAAGVSSQSSGDECMVNMSCECQVCHYLRVTDEMEHFKLLASQLGSPTAFNKNMCFNWQSAADWPTALNGPCIFKLCFKNQVKGQI